MENKVLWNFRVKVENQLNEYEKVGIIGSIKELGAWQLNDCIFLNYSKEFDYYENSIYVDADTINYRYFIAAIDPSFPNDIHVRKWETHLQPRTIQIKSPPSVDLFGFVNGIQSIDKGWLNNEVLMQFRFQKPSFCNKKYRELEQFPINIKITPKNMFFGQINSKSENSDIPFNGPLYSYIEVANVNEVGYCSFTPQEEFGRKTYFQKEDIQIFHAYLTKPECSAYLIDFYSYEDCSFRFPDHPMHIGYGFLSAGDLLNSEGTVQLIIQHAESPRDKIIGSVRVKYLKVTPLPYNLNCDMSASYVRYWKKTKRGIDVGHRGTGTSFKNPNDSHIRENTIASIKKAAESKARFVEFDVQLTIDNHPIVYHDYRVSVVLTKKNDADKFFKDLPLRHFTLDQLKHIKILHTEEGQNQTQKKFEQDDHPEHQPFPELAEVLEVIDPDVGFNIEIKSIQKYSNDKYEDGESEIIDKNSYVDHILEVVLAKAGKRRIIFSSFDADVCVMLRNKQNRYPTLFLTLGEHFHYHYQNPCGRTVQRTAKFSYANEFLGICAHFEDLYVKKQEMKIAIDHGIIVFCWGEAINNKETIDELKKNGVHGIIYDRIDQLISHNPDDRDKFYLESNEEFVADVLEQMSSTEHST